MIKKSVFIAGGGPSGLAAALLFDQLGWQDIVVAERRTSPKDFEKNKSFNYQIDGRGQKLLERVSVADALPDVGVANTAFTATLVNPDGTSKTSQIPIIDPDRPTCYWTTRRNLLTLLAETILERGSDRIELLYGHSVEELIDDPKTNQITVSLTGPSGDKRSFAPDLILACDGLASTMRSAAEARPEVPASHFTMTECRSPSALMRYRVLNFPPEFSAADGQVAVNDKALAYVFPSAFTDFKRMGSLFAFPVAGQNQPRSLNIIREKDHHIWTIEDAESLLEFLEQSYPQLDIRSLVPLSEAEDFVSLRPGQFPEPQYAANISVDLGQGEKQTKLLLIGDAAHAFPPDLGLGVNSALEDLELLAQEIETSDNWREAADTYAVKRLPESKALVRLVQTVFPEQYSTRKWATRKWTLKFVVQRVLNMIVPFFVDKHAFLLTQNPDLPYTEIERLKLRSERNMRFIGWGTLAALAAGVLYALL
ncbi:MAG: NAD(P)/FAD-dependent oxidoreductase [Pseudomonadota bacterium]